MIDMEKSIENIVEYRYSKKIVENVVHIGYGIDENFTRCTATSIASFCINNPDEKFVFHLIADNFSKTSMEKFKLLAKQYNIDIIIYEIDIKYLIRFKLPTKKQWPLSTYFRFIFPFVLKDVEKFFYIDADIICLRKAKDLLHIDLEDKIIGAVKGSDWGNKYRNEAFGLKDHIYFNAGMIVMDINKWNKYDVFQKIIDNITKNPDLFELLDQDALNLVLTKKVKYLKAEYNWFNHMNTDLSKFNCNDVVLLHFTASPKPWNLEWYVSPICNKFNKDLYKDIENMTPWKDTKLIEPKNIDEVKRYIKLSLKHFMIIEAVKWSFKALKLL